jgi:hypothetical protein
MAKKHGRLKLGKRATFVKTHLKQLPQEEETWEADFRPLPKTEGQTDTHYLGLAGRVRQQEAPLRPSSPRVSKRQRRPHSDA